MKALKTNLQFFAENKGTEEQNQQPTEQPAAEPKNTETNPSEQTDKNEPKPIPYDRFKEVNDAYKSYKELGFGTADELKAKLDELKAYEEAEQERKKAEMSEAERLKAEKEEAAKKAEEASEQAKKAQESANQRIINTEIRSIARSLNANDPNDVLALMDKSDVKIDDDGNVTGVEDALKAFKESKPWLFKQPIGADALGGSNPSKNPTADEMSAKEKELEEAKEQAKTNPRMFGKVTKLYNELLDLKNK